MNTIMGHRPDTENVVETMIVGNMEFRLVVELDDDPICPWEDWETLGTLVTWHRRLAIGHEQPRLESKEWLLKLAGVDEDRYYTWWTARKRKLGVGGNWSEALNDKISRELDYNGVVILPVYAYEHGGITISTGSFNCPWDSGQFGYIYATKEKILSDFGKEGRRLGSEDKDRTREILEAEVKIFDQYLTGDVWYWKVESRTIPEERPQTSEDDEDIEWDLIESCHGIYGYDDAVIDGKAELDGSVRRTEN